MFEILGFVGFVLLATGIVVDVANVAAVIAVRLKERRHSSSVIGLPMVLYIAGTALLPPAWGPADRLWVLLMAFGFHVLMAVGLAMFLVPWLLDRIGREIRD